MESSHFFGLVTSCVLGRLDPPYRIAAKLPGLCAIFCHDSVLFTTRSQCPRHRWLTHAHASARAHTTGASARLLTHYRGRHRPSEEDVVMKWQLEARLMNWNGLAGQFWSRYSSGTDLGESWILTVTTKQAAVTCFAGRKVLFCSVPFWGHEVSLRRHSELLTENSFEHLQCGNLWDYQ